MCARHPFIDCMAFYIWICHNLFHNSHNNEHCGWYLIIKMTMKWISLSKSPSAHVKILLRLNVCSSSVHRYLWVYTWFFNPSGIYFCEWIISYATTIAELFIPYPELRRYHSCTQIIYVAIHMCLHLDLMVCSMVLFILFFFTKAYCFHYNTF